jgi:Predicted oxidoreductases (related to aryl-alcohol dehydrogenases)
MRYVEIDGLRTSAIGLGTWQFGSREWGYGDAYADDVAPALVRRAFELGITFIDTAEMYGFGRSERILGASIGDRPDDVIVATKLAPLLPLPAITAGRARASRARLGVDAIDLYQLHFPNPIVPPRTTMRGMRQLLEDGVIRRVGVSNYSLRGWRVAERALGRPVVSNQVRFSLASPSPAWELVPYARDRDRVVIAYSPLAQGLLTRGTDDDATGQRRTVGLTRRNPLARERNRQRARPLLAALEAVARAHGATPAQVALAWVIGHGNVIAIPGARTIEQLEENAAAADLALSADEHDRLTREADRLEASLRT